jgi:tRNA dimethylallyltransferase
LKINAIHSRGKLPILVGGTHFYTQSLLFQNALLQEPSLDSNEELERLRILDQPPDVILAKLKEVDPVMADRWHPKDTRKIYRSLQIYLQTGKPASQIYNEQRLNQEFSLDIDKNQQDNSNESLRFPSLILWVHAAKDVLHSRLDARVDKMLAKGLLSEVEGLSAFRQEYEARTEMLVDQTRGIWQSIGYKEFIEYQRALANDVGLLSKSKQLKVAAIQKTQAATRQYANRQIKWIRLKLLTALIGAGQQNKLFLLDGTELSNWEDAVTAPAVKMTEDFLSGRDLPEPCSLSSLALEMLTPKRAYDFAQRPDLWQRRSCEICGTISVTETDWNLHIKSRAHRRAAGVKKKQEYVVQAQENNCKELQMDVVDILETYMQTFPNADDSG